MNKEFLNTCYRFFNRYITVLELIQQLNNLKGKEMRNLLNEIVKISEEYPNSEDEIVVIERKKTNNLINKLDKIPRNDDELESLYKAIDNMKKYNQKEKDSYERWYKVFCLINDNDYFNSCYEELSSYELLEFIAQYIKAPFPPKLSQDEFEELVKVGMEHDHREWLWRLAFNYVDKEISVDSVVDYFINVKDGYYLVETISAMGEYLDIDKIFAKIDDKKLKEYLNENRDIIKANVSKEQFDKLIN